MIWLGVPQVKGRIELRKPKAQYFGSVRFFKHLIISVMILMMTAPWVVVAQMAANREASRGGAEANDVGMAKANSDLAEMRDRYDEAVERADKADQEIIEMLVLMEQMEASLEKAYGLFDFESAYGYLHPQLRVDGPAEYIDSNGTVYLTFDDGPGPSTRAVLDILKRYDVKATFFVVGYTIPGREETLRRIVEEGHTIGIHTYSHVYREIYTSLEAYLDDFARASAIIEEVAGIKPNIFRFPGGSVNSYNERWGNAVISEMLGRGYRYYDWNVGSGDAATDTSTNEIFEAVIRQVHSNEYSVVLMHDGGGGRGQTVEALPMILDRLSGEGYRFDKLTNQVLPTVFAPTTYSRG
ncbi:MAG: polysaccharide deacetylase [Clostridiales bacterium]|nr:polysaccharide deacetylase [Clostridiales bacterium]